MTTETYKEPQTLYGTYRLKGELIKNRTRAKEGYKPYTAKYGLIKVCKETYRPPTG